MKTYLMRKQLTLLAILPLIIALTACPSIDDGIVDEPGPWSEETRYTPIFIAREDMDKGINFMQEKALSNPGKIYTWNQFIMINEKYEGVHFYDNTNPRSPQKIGFLSVPGNIDMAVKDGFLYVDNAVDLLAINISALPEVSLSKRIQNVFPELTPPDLPYVPLNYSSEKRPANTIIVKWEEK